MTEIQAADGQQTEVSGIVKTFVLDTNVLLHNSNALFMFEDNEVVIPFKVVEEIDKFKKNNDDVGRNARQVIRHLDGLRKKGKLAEGVRWNGHGGTVQIFIEEIEKPAALTEDSPDNSIIAVAWHYFQQGKTTVFISKDINCRIKSDALGIPTEDFEAQKVDPNRLYLGYVEVETEGKIINQLYNEKQIPVETLEPDLFETIPGSEERVPIELMPNQFVLMKDKLNDSHTGLARRRSEDRTLIRAAQHVKSAYGIIPRNVQQKMALDLLMDDDVSFVTLLGTAGSGKTLLAVAAGMAKVLQEQTYDRLLVARPIMPLGRDLGYLPGDKDQKLTQWMQPIFDNLTYLLSTRSAGSQHADSKTPEHRINELMDAGTIVLEPLTYIRGRSIPHQFMIVDEAQNLTPHEVKTIVSRVGEGTKLILTGDIAQIDNPYLDSSSNGLSYAVERLKTSGLVGHIMLERSERSSLASLAALEL